MKVSEAITQANKLRLNTLDDEPKAKWLYALDCDMAEMMGVPDPVFVWPAEDAELLMPAPHDDIYVLYLVAQVDFYNQESALYANDVALYNAAYDDARAWYRRHHVPASKGNWRVM